MPQRPVKLPRSCELEQRLCVAMANLLLIGLGDVERGDHLHRLADITCAALWAEWRVRSKEHVIGAEKFEPAHGSDAAAAERRVGVEVLEAMHQRLAEHLEHAAIVIIRGAAAERRPSGIEPRVEERDHRPEVMDEELEMRQPRA